MAVESERNMLILLDQIIGYSRNYYYEMTKFDLKTHLARPTSNKKKKKNRPPLSGFALSRCSMKKKINRPPPPSGFALSRCSMKKKNKYLTLGRFGRHLRVRGRKTPLLIPEPLSPLPQGNFQCALDPGVAVLGSKIYLIGGQLPRGGDTSPPRGVYTIDASSHSPEMLKMSSELKFGNYHPIVCTIGAKIYVLPVNFLHREIECFDPESNSWTVLRSPREAIYPVESSRFEKLKIENMNFSSGKGYGMRSHAVLGSNLVVSLYSCGGIYTIDTARPDRGWRRILLHLVTEDGSPHLLNFLPLDKHNSSFPIRDDLIFCPPRAYDWGDLDVHIRSSFKMNMCNKDVFVCSFDNVAELSDPDCEFVHVSIHPLPGMKKRRKKQNNVFERWEFVKNSRTIGDEMVLVSRDGCSEYGFDLYQVTRALNSGKYEASKISSATFETRTIFEYMIPVVIKG